MPSRRAVRRRTPEASEPVPDTGLAELSLAKGEEVRFRRRDGEHWKDATVVRREADGSLGLRDGKGALRAIPLERVEARTVGPRGGVVWEPLPERVGRGEQMKLL